MATIKIAKSDFESALKVVGNTVTAGGSDISTHYLFRVAGGKLSLLSYSGRVFSSCPVVATSDTEETLFTAEAWRIGAMLNATPNNTVLTLIQNGSEVKVQTDRGKIELSSLDPSLFPFWDTILGEAKETAKISADRLKKAYAHARMFVSTDEQRSPHLCVAEFREGCLYSTDQTGVSTIRVQGMEKSSLRVHGKDIGNLISFLDSAKGQDVTILEHERALFVVRADGAVFGETVFSHPFPAFSVSWELADDHTWEFFTEEFANNVRFLISGAAKGDPKILLAPKVGVKGATMTMTSVGGKPMTVDLPLQNQSSLDEAAALPEGGFHISHPHFTLTLGDFDGSLVSIGISKRGKGGGGWVRVREDRGGDIFLTTIAWIKTA